MVSPVRIRVSPLKKFLQNDRNLEAPGYAPGASYTNRYTNALFQGILHRARRLITHAGEDVGVGVQSDANVGVAQ